VELAEYWGVIRRHWLSVLAAVILGGLLAGIVSLLMRPIYAASASVFVSVQSGTSAGELQQGSTYAANQVKSFAQIATMPVVLDPVIAKLGLDTTAVDLAKSVTATVPTNTAIIEIGVVGTDPVATADIANEVSTRLVAVVGQLAPSGKDNQQAVVATVVAPAAVPTEWTSPRVSLNLALGLLLGLLVGVGQAVLRSRLDTRVVTEDDVALVTDSSVIGTISYDKIFATEPLVMTADPQSPRAEAFRRLRTNLQFLTLEGRSRILVITSSIAGEGKSTTAINIATTLADAGESVLLIEADMRRPKIGDYLGIESAAGLSTVIIGRAGLADVVQPVGAGVLHVMASGQLPPNPAELLASDAMKALLEEAAATYDTVLLDCPPLLPVTDAAVLSSLAAGALVVVGSGSVTRPELADSLQSVELAGGRVLGLGLNMAKVEHVGYGRDHYYRHYGVEPAKS
jgi:capsular exopolysaccharide synthesis family protein